MTSDSLDDKQLRDVFACFAMQGILAAVRGRPIDSDVYRNGYNLDGLGMESYQIADMMMEARKK